MAKQDKTPGASLGEPAGRLLELFKETTLPQPYEVSDSITIAPPTKKSAEAMDAAHLNSLLYQSMLNAALTRQPTPDTPAATDEELAELSKRVSDAQLAWNQAFFGDQYDNLLEFFADRPRALWDAFVDDIKKRFLPSGPPDGRCPTCGHVDEEQAGKEPPSST